MRASSFVPRRQAIDIALDTQAKPRITSFLSVGPLPDGLKCLLRIVAEGEWRDDSTEHVYMRHNPATVHTACAAFLCEVLFSRQTDPYRVLGLAPGAPLGDVREHKRLLFKWLHPDRNPAAREQEYLARVIAAAEAIESGRSDSFSDSLPPRAPQAPAPAVDVGVGGRWGAGAQDEKAWTAITRTARRVMSRLVSGVLRAVKLSAALVSLLLLILLAWRYVMGEAVGDSLTRYTMLALGSMNWQ